MKIISSKVLIVAGLHEKPVSDRQNQFSTGFESVTSGIPVQRYYNKSDLSHRLLAVRFALDMCTGRRFGTRKKKRLV